MKLLALIGLISITNACNLSTNNTEIMNDNTIISLVKSNDTKALELALKAGAKVNTKDHNNRNLVLIATINKQTEMAKLLTENGADVNQQANNLDSAFLYAGASGQTELVKLFLENGARFDIFNRYNGTALIPACERGHVETVKLLASTKNFPINHVNRLGWTGLMEAVVLGDGSSKYQDIIKILLENGADKNIPDSDGITALQHAKARRQLKIIELLSSYK